MTSELKYSIIVPVYNTKRNLLEKCLMSIINQKNIQANYEIIVIDDGSTNEETINYLKNINSPLCKIIFDENHGVSHARNVGIKASKSDNLIFVDSDDYVTENLLSILNEINPDKYDCIFWKNLIIKENSKHFRKCKEYNNGTVWGKLFKKTIIVENNISFNTKLRFCEDTIFLKEYLTHCDQILHMDKYEYIYVENVKSVGHRFNKNNYLYFNDTINALYEYLSNDDINNTILWLFLDFVLPTSVYNKHNKISYREKKKIATSILKKEELNYKKILTLDVKKFKWIRKIQILLLRKQQYVLALLINKIKKIIKK